MLDKENGLLLPKFLFQHGTNARATSITTWEILQDLIVIQLILEGIEHKGHTNFLFATGHPHVAMKKDDARDTKYEFHPGPVSQ